MNLRLDDNVAVIVGGASGLGHAIAAGFLAEGAKVAILDRNPETPAVAASFSPNTLGLIADVTDFQAIRAAAAQVHHAFGRFDHIVFAAAVGSGKFGFPFWNLDPADWDRVLQVNLIGAANIAHTFAPTLAESRRGTMLFIASIAGQIGSQTDPPYSASKAGVINFAQCAAKDLAPFGVRVNTLCPGMVKTALNQSVYEAWAAQQPAGPVPCYDEWAAAKIKNLVPLNRWQTPEDIAAMAVFLASPKAANITGQTINIDGGFVMHW